MQHFFVSHIYRKSNYIWELVEGLLDILRVYTNIMNLQCYVREEFMFEKRELEICITSIGSEVNSIQIRSFKNR